MSAVQPVELFDDEYHDPDTLKVPENPAHRQAVDLIALLAQLRLGDDQVVYRDMNWYPPDGGNAIAPDVMVLPQGALPAGAKSHKQATLGGPTPSVVVEVPSDSDVYHAFRRKLLRYRQLGVVVYVVEVETGECSITRAGEEGDAPWADRPIPELGGLVLTVDGGRLAARLSDGTLVHGDGAAVVHLLTTAERARAEAEQAHARIAALEEQLRARGIEPSG